VNRWSRVAAVVVLGMASLGAATSTPGKRAYCSLAEFACYYQALGAPAERAGFWERLTVSIVLAGSGDLPPGHARKCPVSRNTEM
jgi:hypothetical protein